MLQPLLNKQCRNDLFIDFYLPEPRLTVTDTLVQMDLSNDLTSVFFPPQSDPVRMLVVKMRRLSFSVDSDLT